jgi:hypothetical protein
LGFALVYLEVDHGIRGRQQRLERIASDVGRAPGDLGPGFGWAAAREPDDRLDAIVGGQRAQGGGADIAGRSGDDDAHGQRLPRQSEHAPRFSG